MREAKWTAFSPPRGTRTARTHESGGRGGAEEGKGGQTRGGEGTLGYGGRRAVRHADGVLGIVRLKHVINHCRPNTFNFFKKKMFQGDGGGYL